MRRITRRRFLQVSGVGAAAAQAGGTYAKAIQGTAPEEAVKWAQGELTQVYT